MRLLAVLIVLLVSVSASAQYKTEFFKPKKGTVCYSSPENVFTNLPAPEEYLRRSKARTKTANIIVTYDGFTDQAKAAFQEAVDIWESILVSDVTIYISARWTALGAGVLGSASPGTYIRNFDGAQRLNVWYPVALAEKVSGKELTGAEDPDIVASFNSANASWNFGLSGTPPAAGQYDMVSIVLHEIGHGLGITHAYEVAEPNGQVSSFFGLPVVYESFLQNGAGKSLVSDFTSPSTDLKSQLTGGDLFFATPLVKAANSNLNAKVYTPTAYAAGSSVAHLDESAFPAGSINSLMTPFIAAAERNLNPGPVVKAILKEMGWTTTIIQHTALKNTESTTGPYTVTAKIVNEGGYDASTVKLNYNTGGAFTTVAMTATANANEFTFDLPAGSSKYNYYISVVDNDQRTFTKPGVRFTVGSPTSQSVITFEAGPDTKAPTIYHIAKEFITTKDTLKLVAGIKDNIGVAEAKVEWQINGVDQPVQTMTLKSGSDTTYVKNIIFAKGQLANGDKVGYRIRAKDTSVAGNIAAVPTTSTFYVVNVTGLGETVDNYRNDFNNLSGDDFFGNGFSVIKPTGFDNGAIHSNHPYAEAGANNHLDFIYTLKNPIRLKAGDGALKFDEIVLVEPGTAGVAWPGADFFDYVVVEGSVDGGTTWKALADGYDARLQSAWLTAWNTGTSGNNSTGVGTPAMYITHTFNMLDKFKAGEEVAVRFRMYSDPFSAGWGWSIDNLRIQIDDVPPTILHNHVDYLLTGATELEIKSNITDARGLNQIFVDYNVNGGTLQTTELIVDPLIDTYSLKLDLTQAALKAGDVVRYKVRAIDKAGNVGVFPSTDFIKVAVIGLSTSVDGIFSNFSEESTDFTGNFITRSQPSSFTDFSMNTAHPYPAGFGLTKTSNLVLMTTKPVKIRDVNPFLFFDEIALVEYDFNGAKDFAVVEGSKDGITWERLEDPYAANANTTWRSAFDNNVSGNVTLVKTHKITLTTSGKFKAGDAILVRFRLFTDATTTGWGWMIDNVSIQGPNTGLESALSDVDIFPNPVSGGMLNVKCSLPGTSDVSVEIMTTQGQIVESATYAVQEGEFERQYATDAWSNGLYVVRVRSNFGSTVGKFVKVR